MQKSNLLVLLSHQNATSLYFPEKQEKFKTLKEHEQFSLSLPPSLPPLFPFLLVILIFFYTICAILSNGSNMWYCTLASMIFNN